MKQVQFLFWVLDVRVNEEGVGCAVDVFNCNLEAVEAAGFAIEGSKECKVVGDEVVFSVRQPVPVREV